MLKKKHALFVAILGMILQADLTVRAQTTTAKDQLDTSIAAAVASVKANQQAAFGIGRNIRLFALGVALRNQPQVFVEMAEDVRVDKQVGSSESNAGSTSLVSKGSVPSILGLAVENGALTREISGTTITFRGNPVGIAQALSNAGFIESYQNTDASTRFLRRLSFALSFDTSRGIAPVDTNVFTGDRQQLASYSFRFDIVNKRDPRDKAYSTSWNRLVAGDALAMNAALDKFDELLEKDSTFLAWQKAAEIEVQNHRGAPEAEVEKVIRAQLDKLTDLEFAPTTEAAAESFVRAFNSFLQTRDKILEAVGKGPIVTFEYTNIRKVDAVDQSNFKLIAEGAFFNGRADLTANASFTILNKIPVGTTADRLQDVDLSAQLDVPLGEVQKIGSIVLSFAGKYKHMMQDTMTDGEIMADTRGDIGVGQIKLTIPVKGSGVRIPISLTFANRTELVKESFVRGNIGVTFDLDSIFARLKP